MPCDCSHLQANELEIELSRVLVMLEEVKTGKHVDPASSDWRGYKKDVYSRYSKKEMRERADAATAELCGLLSRKRSVSKHSLELQMWWRDHQAADKAKAKAAKAAKAKKKNPRRNPHGNSWPQD